MVRISKIVTLAAALAFPLVASVTAASAATPSYVTRGQYVEELLTAVGVQPDSTATQTFSDVPPSSPYFGYVEAAYKAGITTGMVAPSGGQMGVFGVDQDLDRAEAAAFDLRAYDGGVASYAEDTKAWAGKWNPSDPAAPGTQVSFLDYAAIPAALQGDVYVAASIGLLHGFPDGTFGPLQNLTAAQTADLIAQLKAVEAIDGGSYHWRWIDSAHGTATEPRAVNAMAFFAAAIQGEPFSAVSSYIDQGDAGSLQTAYTAIQQQWQEHYASKVPSIVWKIVGGGYVVGGFDKLPADYVECVDTLQLEATTSAGAPVNLQNVMGIGGAGGPYVEVSLADVVTDPNGLVSDAGTPYDIIINHDSSDIVTSGQSVAGVAMEYVGDTAAISAGGMAEAVVAGEGEAYQGIGQNLN